VLKAIEGRCDVGREIRAARTDEKPFQFSVRQMLIAVTILAVILSLGGWAVRVAREEARISRCQNNLKQIALALHNYHDAFRHFPTAFSRGADGTPWHSWRVDILPFIEQQPLYNSYRVWEPWNGPTNRKLSKAAPDCLRCPFDESPATDTSYLAVTGPGTIWPDDGPASFRDILDGTSNTIMVVEVANSGVHWMEPRDLRIDEMDFKIDGTPGKSISSHHVRGAAVVFTDGRVKLLGPETAADTIKSWMLTTDQAEAKSPK
jgi:type II secretory pathway pseudopilin PulG